MDVDKYIPDKPCKKGHSLRYIKTGHCVECVAINRRNYDKNNPDSQKKRNNKFNKTPKGRIRKMFYNAKNRAKRLGIPFCLSLSDIKIPSHCPLLGIALLHGNNGPHGASPTLDRIIPHLGYTKDNILVISHRANSIKNDASPKDLRLIADNLELVCGASRWI